MERETVVHNKIKKKKRCHRSEIVKNKKNELYMGNNKTKSYWNKTEVYSSKEEIVFKRV